MKRQWLEFLVCPEHQLPLRSSTADLDLGPLLCPACGPRATIAGDVVDFLTQEPDSGDEESDPAGRWKRGEIEVRDREASVYESLFPPLRGSAEVEATLHALGVADGVRIIDLGIGIGRLARRYGRGTGGVLGVDYSLTSLRHAQEGLSAAGIDACLVRADITRLPIRSGAFEVAVSTQVLQHLPAGAEFARAIQEAHRVLTPGGTIVLSVYHWSVVKRLRSLFGMGGPCAREGTHSGGKVYYRNFRWGELHQLLRPLFRVEQSSGIVMQLGPSLRETSRVGVVLDRWLRRTPLARPLAHLLLVRATRL